MKSLKEAKAAIYNTECQKLIYEGLSRSEPIMTIGEKGIIDNFFIYSANQEHTRVSKPMAFFGIYSELNEVAYINFDVYDPTAESKNNSIDINIVDDKYLTEYEKLYESVREFLQKDCSDDQREILRSYVEHLYMISGIGLWNNYKEMAPLFFEWVNTEGIVIE